jgi:hypothetical protein
MQTSDSTTPKSASPLQYGLAAVPSKERITLPEALLLARYHLRLLDWWLFLLMLLGFLGAGVLVWIQQHAGNSQGLRNAIELSRFVMEPGAGLLAGMFASSVIVSDPLLEVTVATRGGVYGVVIWRLLLTFFMLLICSAAYLAWSLYAGISYAGQQNPLFLLLVWLAPVLVMGMLGLLGSLLTRNAPLGMAMAAIPLAASLFLSGPLFSIEAAHPFFISYTYSGGQDAPDWWTNRLVLLAVALGLGVWNWWLLRREEPLLL